MALEQANITWAPSPTPARPSSRGPARRAAGRARSRAPCSAPGGSEPNASPGGRDLASKPQRHPPNRQRAERSMRQTPVRRPRPRSVSDCPNKAQPKVNAIAYAVGDKGCGHERQRHRGIRPIGVAIKQSRGQQGRPQRPLPEPMRRQSRPGPHPRRSARPGPGRNKSSDILETINGSEKLLRTRHPNGTRSRRRPRLTPAISQRPVNWRKQNPPGASGNIVNHPTRNGNAIRRNRSRSSPGSAALVVNQGGEEAGEDEEHRHPEESEAVITASATTVACAFLNGQSRLRGVDPRRREPPIRGASPRMRL